MKLNTARIKGFQSFSDTGEIEFSDGINLVIGQNNSGKSALLRALRPEIPDDRHRTPDKWETFKLARPRITLRLSVCGAEFRDWVLRSGREQWFPMSAPTPTQPNHLAAAESFMRRLFEKSNICMVVGRTPTTQFSSPYPSHRLFQYTPGAPQFAAHVVPDGGELRIGVASAVHDTLPALLFEAWRREMFYFAAERMTIGEAPAGYANRLQPNATNLPNVLHSLANERGNVFQQLVSHLREVFPTVGNLSIRTRPDKNNLEILLWPTEEMERVELSFPLNSSGTGVAQVIALLAGIMTIDNGVFLIDEISSFLHPAAVKTLLRILQTEYIQHQPLDITDLRTFGQIAGHLGVSMADVFAAERVIWVEGPTEELCFPYLYQKLSGPLPRGTIFTSVAATGDFYSNKRNPAIVYEVYSRLSAAAASLVVSVLFSFDTEKLTDPQKAEMQRNSHGLLHFLPRRHFECYLVSPAAIAAFIINKDPASIDTVTAEAVKEVLQAAAAERPFHIREWKEDITDDRWLARVDAANLIASVCGALSDQRVPFAKKDDSLFLLSHILEHEPAQLASLHDYIAGLVAEASAMGSQ